MILLIWYTASLQKSLVFTRFYKLEAFPIWCKTRNLSSIFIVGSMGSTIYHVLSIDSTCSFHSQVSGSLCIQDVKGGVNDDVGISEKRMSKNNNFAEMWTHDPRLQTTYSKYFAKNIIYTLFKKKLFTFFILVVINPNEIQTKNIKIKARFIKLLR